MNFTQNDILYIPWHSSGTPDQDPSGIHRIVSSPSRGIGNSSLQMYWITDPGALLLPIASEVFEVGTLSHGCGAKINMSELVYCPKTYMITKIFPLEQKSYDSLSNVS